ncbi:hypothetical protein T4A_3723 [Trichinella pseudospiralis]|uniref:Uncharacterized protein n=1 Tax=Trichinella pseudospiralis TaxID=6337 RepID=A0A0V1D9I4_TRIPS|nr:hypothetical protein T4A_11479 [Trichinella pseudospiralis]KRY58265.1 hypothetical protein T4A_3723 [Trichinella pseudospiralis]KRY64065.1 hypothetical protein T4D_4555 [Trichinella pseudospiralis]
MFLKENAPYSPFTSGNDKAQNILGNLTIVATSERTYREG